MRGNGQSGGGNGHARVRCCRGPPPRLFAEARQRKLYVLALLTVLWPTLRILAPSHSCQGPKPSDSGSGAAKAGDGDGEKSILEHHPELAEALRTYRYRSDLCTDFGMPEHEVAIAVMNNKDNKECAPSRASARQVCCCPGFVFSKQHGAALLYSIRNSGYSTT